MWLVRVLKSVGLYLFFGTYFVYKTTAFHLNRFADWIDKKSTDYIESGLRRTEAY